AVADLDGDGAADLLSITPGVQVRVRSVASGAVLLSIPLSSSGLQQVSDVGDVDADGVPDIALGDPTPTTSAHVVVYSGANGSTIYT
ncbi:MAG: VCBS repeat-containing protein, partial [Myxococcales bacterium]|nr:VCBS repeat-containing protein [Myxococcales bacterium]